MSYHIRRSRLKKQTMTSGEDRTARPVSAGLPCSNILQWLLKQFAVFVQPFFFQILRGNKAKRGGIEAVAQAGGSRAVGKDMAKVRIALPASHLGAHREQAVVHLFDDIGGYQGLGEAGPAGFRVILVGGTEQRLAGDNINVNARFLVVPVQVVKGRFGAVFLGDLVLQRGQTAF